MTHFAIYYLRNEIVILATNVYNIFGGIHFTNYFATFLNYIWRIVMLPMS
jgi:hypothetical protein